MEPLSFDIHDRASWYFGAMSRQEATDLLLKERGGVFLVRDSSTMIGEYVLSVSEGPKVSHYIINIVLQDGVKKFRMGDQYFEDLQDILAFYKEHYLDTTPLIRPASKKIEKVITKFDFDGNDAEDLPFRRGEILTVISKDEEQWWSAKNFMGKVGQIPVPYVEKYDESQQQKISNKSERPGSGGSSGSGGGVGGLCGVITGNNSTRLPNSHSTKNSSCLRKLNLNRQMPAYAKVIQARVPNAYDKTALKLEVNDIIKVTRTSINGQWEGELKGKKGHFPFTHVEFIDDYNGDINNSAVTNGSAASAQETLVGNN